MLRVQFWPDGETLFDAMVTRATAAWLYAVNCAESASAVLRMHRLALSSMVLVI